MSKKFYKLEVNKRDLEKIFADLPKKTKAATANTLNVIVRKVNANIKTHISGKYNVKKSSMKFGKLVSISRADARRNRGTATIYIKNQGRGLMKYSAKDKRPKGITVKVKKVAKRIKSAYISPLRKGSGQDFVFRKGQGKNAGRITRISEKGTAYQADKREIMYGAPIADLYTNLGAMKVMMSTIDLQFQDELDKQMARQFER